ncbi:GTPase-activating protein CdGAPr-like [Achroia grisella]|uniref:GTPase-activating protein CdGAPr-like n=1 Tax=Achroia grisella TaxID=688607 RepID=UPI0027D27A3B|nr:GTPase-activating protein CdGAPr-like [Achroia grisella]
MLSGSPHGSVMSCQSLAARAFTEPDKENMTHCATAGLHRSVRFSSDSRSSTRTSNNDQDCKREATGSISLTALAVTPVSQSSSMSQSAPPSSVTFDLAETPAPAPACRFPKLEECAHFHYERVSLGGLSVQTVPCEEQAADPTEGWVCLKVRSHVNSSSDESTESRLTGSWTEASDVREWTLTRNKDNFLQLDDMLHRCIYDRKVSGLPNLAEKIGPSLLQDELEYNQLISDYVHHLSIIADDSINCGPVLNWLQMDNKGHKLLVANEDSSSINTPAVAAAYSVRKYVSQASTCF